MRGRVVQNVAALLGGRAASIVLSGAASVVLTRHLGALRYGQYSAIYAFLALFGWLSTFGFEALLPRLVAGHPALTRGLVFTSSVTSAVTSSVAMLVALVGGVGLEYPLSLLLLAATDVLLLAPVRLPGSIYQAELRQWLPVGVGIGRQTAWLFALGLLSWSGGGLLSIVAARLLLSVTEVAILLVALRTRLAEVPLGARLVRPRTLLFAAIPLALNSLAVTVYHRIDQTLLFRLVGARELGQYALAAGLVELLGALPVALMSSIFPLLVQNAAIPDRFDHYLRLTTRYLLALVPFACLVGTLAAPYVIRLLYGPEFESAATLLRILIWSEVPVALGVVLANALVAMRLQRYIPVSTVTGAVMNLSANVVWIPQFGAKAAAWVTLVSYSLAGAILFLFVPATRQVAWLAVRAALWPVALAAVLTLAALQLPGLHLQVGLSLSLYVAGLFATRSLTKEDCAKVWSLVPGKWLN